MTIPKIKTKPKKQPVKARAVKLDQGPGAITTASGLRMPAEGDASLFRISDIATGLAKRSRYAGQCEGFYSVAEHSTIMANRILAETGNTAWAQAALLHDAVEAYWGDIPAPYKVFVPQFEEMEEKWLQKVFERFPGEYPLPDIVKEYDLRIRIDEVEVLFPPGYKVLTNMPPDAKPLGVMIRSLEWPVALAEFLRMAEALGIKDD